MLSAVVVVLLLPLFQEMFAVEVLFAVVGLAAAGSRALLVPGLLSTSLMVWGHCAGLSVASCLEGRAGRKGVLVLLLSVPSLVLSSMGASGRIAAVDVDKVVPGNQWVR